MKKGVITSASLVALLIIVYFLRPAKHDAEVGGAVGIDPGMSNNAVTAHSSERREPPGNTPKQGSSMQTVASGLVETNKWEWLKEMTTKDSHFEYKAPISFYGRIVDEDGNAVRGVKVDCSLVDASEATGVSLRTATSDNNGRFSIQGARGKSLLVTLLTKTGYTPSTSQNNFAFNYGWFPDPSYHAPDPMNPVTFVMHKNKQKEPLLEVHRRFPASTNQPTLVNLGGSDSTSIRIDVVQNQVGGNGQNGAWSIRVSVPDGGIQVSTNEFPFEAPETGYQPSILVDRNTAKPKAWAYPYLGGEFFVRTRTGYGRMRLQMLEGSPHFSINSFYNPHNSPNLEP